MGKFCSRLVALTMTGVLGLGASSAFAEKIAVVDIGRAIFNTDSAKARLKQMQAKPEYASLQARYESIGADIKALNKEMETSRLTASAAKNAEYQKKMDYLRADLELVARKLETEIKGLQGEIMKELQPKVLEVIQELVKQEKVTLLLPREVVIYAPPESDLTPKFIERLNKK